MKATWTKLENGKSFLVLVFGHISAEVVNLGPAGVINSTWGILTHPFVAETLIGTIDEAQARAEAILRGILAPAVVALG